ncbi:MAG TPA: carboxylesterase family protein [Pseudomonadales bacterium]|nr:carboxylesterase family protein [Pseudomonadales bacterium]
MRKIVIAILVLIAAAVAAFVFWPKHKEAPPVADQATLRQTPLGPVVGYVDAYGAHAWLGLPFAAPPVGELRWKAPRPVQPWSDVRRALAIGNMCVQFPSLLSGAGRSPSNAPVGDEDCLYLNVWAPPFTPADVPTADKARPVMVWIHGGGNSIGHGGSYNGAHLAAGHDVVVVTINYRLGPFGWFSHPALRSDAASPEDNSGNYGILDQIAALHWVRDNIAAFGGNPDNITIFGESAGGADVLALLASPLAKGLFHRAIVESGGLFTATRAIAENYRDDPDPGHPFSSREVIDTLLVRNGKAADASAAKAAQNAMSNDDLRAMLLNTKAADIMQLYAGGAFGMISAPEVVGDGYVLPADIDSARLFADPTKYNSVPVILGTNRDEVALFMVRDPRWVETRFWIFPRLKDPVGYQREVRYQTDAWRRRGVDDLAAALIRSQPGQVFAYRFDWDEEPTVMGYDLSRALGAAHGLEIAFVFGEFEGGLGLSYLYPKTPARDALSNSMMSYWAEFAYTGNPGTGRDGKEVRWLPWDPDGLKTIVFDTPPPGIHMSSEVVTADNLKQRLLGDTTITDQKQYCALYAQLFHGAEFDRSEYLKLGQSGCAAYDPESFRRF